MTRRRARGLTAWEVVLATTIGFMILGGGIAVTNSTSEVARSSASDDAASRHVERVMRLISDDLRCASLASLRHADGTTAFADGTSDEGITLRRVLGFSGGLQLDSDATYRLVRPAGQPLGEVVRIQDGVTQTVARGITALTVSRSGDGFTLSVASHSGPDDDRGRNARGSVSVRTRNP